MGGPAAAGGTAGTRGGRRGPLPVHPVPRRSRRDAPPGLARATGNRTEWQNWDLAWEASPAWTGWLGTRCVMRHAPCVRWSERARMRGRRGSTAWVRQAARTGPIAHPSHKIICAGIGDLPRGAGGRRERRAALTPFGRGRTAPPPLLSRTRERGRTDLTPWPPLRRGEGERGPGERKQAGRARTWGRWRTASSIEAHPPAWSRPGRRTSGRWRAASSKEAY